MTVRWRSFVAACAVPHASESEAHVAFIAKVRFRLEGPRDGFSGFEPSWARLMSTLRGRFQTTKGPDVALGTFVMSRCEDPICSYYLSRCRTSVHDQAHDEI